MCPFFHKTRLKKSKWKVGKRVYSTPFAENFWLPTQSKHAVPRNKRRLLCSVALLGFIKVEFRNLFRVKLFFIQLQFLLLFFTSCSVFAYVSLTHSERHIRTIAISTGNNRICSHLYDQGSFKPILGPSTTISLLLYKDFMSIYRYKMYLYRV